MTIQDAIEKINNQLKGILPDRELTSIGFIILEHLLYYSKTEILLNKSENLDYEVEYKIQSIILRLKKHEPIQYILGKTEFYGLKFKLTTDVLIPRQETEELVKWIVNDNKNKCLSIIDIGTGSGCIAIGLAKKLQNCIVTATDNFEPTIKVAKENALKNKVNVFFLKCNMFEDINHEKPFDIVVSNPPYIRDKEKLLMSLNVLDYEPANALFVPDNDPLKYYKTIVKFCKDNLINNGKLYLEINEDLSKETEILLSEYNFYDIEIRKDINNKPRMIKALYGK